MKKIVSVLFLSATFALLGACSSADDPSPKLDGDTSEMGEGEADFEAESEAPAALATPTTLKETLLPGLGTAGETCLDHEEEAYCQNPALAVPDISVYSAHDMGLWSVGAGEGFTTATTQGSSLGTPGTRRSLFSWAHVSDIHITDEESPNRMAKFDFRPSAPTAALRPGDMYTEIVLDAMIRTLNAIHKRAPLALLLITGDMVDSAQKNEMNNFAKIMTGGTVNPDSGADDDPLPGPGNDPQDAFEAEGSALPWIVALGNHDELVLGNSAVTEATKTASKGTRATAGTRNGQTFAVTTETPADAERETLTHKEMLALLRNTPGQPAGHGFSAANLESDSAYYSYDPPNSLVRFIILDTTFRPNGFTGQVTYVKPVIDRKQFDDFLVPAMERAKSEKKLVILAYHHASHKLQDDGSPSAYVSTEELEGKLLTYPNLLLACIGHSHENTLRLKPNPQGGGYFEVQASSLIEWPQQARLYELVDNGNGTLSIFTTTTNFAAAPGSLAETARRYALINSQAGWGEGGQGVLTERNVEMVFKAPEGFAEAIQAAAGGPRLQAQSGWTE